MDSYLDVLSAILATLVTILLLGLFSVLMYVLIRVFIGG